MKMKIKKTSKKVSASQQSKAFLEMNQEDKLQCLNTIRGFVTLNSISKDTLKTMFDWLFDETVDVEEVEEK